MKIWTAVWGWVTGHVVQALAVLALVFMFLPNVVVAVFSFNHPKGRFNFEWNRFSLDAWANPCAPAGLCQALGTSVTISVLATLIAVLLGTMLAFAVVRYRFRGRDAANTTIFIPMSTPDVVMGASLLALFINVGVPLGFWTVLIAHVMFLISYVVTTVKARLIGTDRTLEQAAMDLYASPSQTFWRITFPAVLPGILAAAVLAFSLSFDDFVVTNFNSGATVTFPMYVWGAAQRGTPPQISVIGTMFFVGTVVVVLLGQLLAGARARAKARA